jgi:hypothetical protein
MMTKQLPFFDSVRYSHKSKYIEPMSINPSNATLAFRTTTTLLSRIPSRLGAEPDEPDDESGQPEGDMARRHPLVLSVAFAILAVVKHDVVAVAAKLGTNPDSKLKVCLRKHF